MLGAMQEQEIIQGRIIGPETIALIRQLLAAHPDWNRSRLSRELCARWDWVTPTGQVKDMPCRTLLLKLERRGLIVLPARQRPSPNARRNRSISPVPHAREPIHAAIGELLPVQLAPVHEQPEQGPLFKWLVSQHHYRGKGSGLNLQLVV